MAKKKQVAIEVKIKDIQKIKELEESLKKLRKEQREMGKDAKARSKMSQKEANDYKKKAKVIKEESKALRERKKALVENTKASQNARKSSGSLTKSFVKGAAAVGIIITAFRRINQVISSMIKTFTEFEFVMAKVQAISGATDKEFKQLTATAEELGRTTFFTAEQVGQLQLNYSKLGFTADEIMAAQKATLDLATATGSDLARSAIVAGAAVRGFGLDASETGRVVDVMAVAFSSSALDIEKWQTSMTKVAPIAKSAGFSIEDTAAIMAKLTDSGIEASIAGTSLRNILLKMQDPSSDLSRTFGHTVHSLDEMIPAMKKFIAEGGDMADILGVVDLRQAAAFEQMLSTADATLLLRDSLKEANGEGERMAGIVGDTLHGGWLKFKSALQGVSIALMKNFAQGVTESLVKLADLLNSMAKGGETFKKFTKTVKQVTVALSAYWIGLKASWVWSKLLLVQTGLLSVKTFLFSKGATAATVATNLWGVATGRLSALLSKMSAALARTGIGLLVIAVADLIYHLKSFNEEALKSIDIVSEMETRFEKQSAGVKTLEEEVKLLVKAKKEMNRLADEEGKLFKDTKYNQIKYADAVRVATRSTRMLNVEFKKNGGELITLQTEISETKKRFKELAKQMQATALTQIYSKLSTKIVEQRIKAEDIRDKMMESFGITSNEFEAVAATAEDYYGSAAEWGDKVRELLPVLDKTEYGKMADELKVQMEEQGITLGTLNEVFAYSPQEYVREGMERLGGKIGEMSKEMDIVLGDFSEEEKKKGLKSVEDWALIMTQELSKIKQEYLDGKITEVQFAEQSSAKKIEILKQELATVSKVSAAGKKKAADINSAIIDEELKMLKGKAAEKLRILELDNSNAAAAIQEKIDNNIISETVGKNMLLQLEGNFLAAKKMLHEAYNLDMMDLSSELLAHNVDVNARQMQIMNEQISAMGGVGSGLQQLAGDNKKLNKIKEAGVAISRAAALADTVLKLKKDLLTLSTVQATVASEKETATSMLSIPVNIAEGASKQAKLPFPINIIAIIATLALLAKVMGVFEKGGVVEEFANGGVVRGKSHAQGGEKFAVGGRVVELEGGEAVINKRSTSMFRSQLSSINEAGGGVKFADGGLLNQPSFAASKFQAVSNDNMMNAIGNNRKVVVLESDITETQNNISVIESEATF